MKKQSTVSTSATLPEIGLVRLPAILAVYPVSRSHWWAGVKTGRYPQPIKVSQGITCWQVSDIRALINRVAGEAN